MQKSTLCEAALGVIAPFNLADEPRGQDVRWFTDDQAACADLVKGSSTHEILEVTCYITQLMITR